MDKNIAEALETYNQDITIGTLGSHSALNIFKGAKEEGFKTVCVCKKGDEIVYSRFPLADEIILVNNFKELLDERIQDKLKKMNTVLIPHGSFNAYIGTENMIKKLSVPMFGNKNLLHWETNREMQRKWLIDADLKLPKVFKSPEDIKGLAIVKYPGARGGKGYFLAHSKETFYKKGQEMINNGHMSEDDLENAHIQEYIIGVNIYTSYFHSVLNDETEFLGVDKRYESFADNIGRIPANEQIEMNINPTYTIVGNIPLTLRESLLPEYLRMGDRVVKQAKKIAEPGIVGPFCLETVVTENLEIVTFEISARIVAGTNVGIGTSPYAYLKYGEKMYMGRRIAKEIKEAVKTGRLKDVVT
ncbi:MAG: formate--phosphoribosylaminoimidazolecarboxamide ligase [Candidatus Thermoplasmatota archaeon]|nr:formate--phosphoribosylaminoimidazolecarboxamide ligase [Candidatus Thermoplasmatota archaeon]